MSEPISTHHKDCLLAQIKCNDLWLPCCVDRGDYNSYLEFQVMKSTEPRSIRLKAVIDNKAWKDWPMSREPKREVIWSYQNSDNLPLQQVVKDFKATEVLKEGFERPNLSALELVHTIGRTTNPTISSLLNGDDIEAIDLTWTSSGAAVIGFDDWIENPLERGCLQKQLWTVCRQLRQSHTISLRLLVEKGHLVTVRRFVDVANPTTPLKNIGYGEHSYSPPSKQQLILKSRHEKATKAKIKVQRRRNIESSSEITVRNRLSPLLRIPSTLRSSIYQLVFEDEELELDYKPDETRLYNPGRADYLKYGLNLLLTCRDIEREVEVDSFVFIFSKFKFSSDQAVSRFAHMVDDADLAKIQHLRLDISDKFQQDWDATIKDILVPKFIHLRSFSAKIRIAGHFWLRNEALCGQRWIDSLKRLNALWLLNKGRLYEFRTGISWTYADLS